MKVSHVIERSVILHVIYTQLNVHVALFVALYLFMYYIMYC